jgi:hypothetical protein
MRPRPGRDVRAVVRETTDVAVICGPADGTGRVPGRPPPRIFREEARLVITRDG